jgi:hypothetical protein
MDLNAGAGAEAKPDAAQVMSFVFGLRGRAAT